MDDVELWRDDNTTSLIDEEFLSLGRYQSETFMEIIGAVELKRNDDLTRAIDKAPLVALPNGEECLRGLALRLRGRQQ